MNEQFKSNLIYKFWNGLKIRWKIISIILPTAIIPLVIIIVFSNIRIYNHLEKQGKNFYSTLITQVNKNIDLIYEQYGRTLANMMTISSVQAGLYAPPYKSKQQENDVKKSVMGDATTEGGFRSTAEEKIDGNVHIYELDRKSLVNGTDYTVHILNASVGVLDFNKLLNDPLYLEVKNNNKIRMIFGKLKPGVSSTTEYDARPTIILPYYQTPPEKETDTFTKFVVISLNNDFIPKFFEDMEPLRFGTLYILDRFDNIISSNHPSSDYYYDYDDIKKCYVLGEDDPNPEDEPMNFNDFKIINTDEKILEKEEVKNMLDSTEWGESTKIINFKGREYLAICQHGEQTETKYIYFHPIKQFQKPVFEIIGVILTMTLIVIVVIIIISFMFSRTFTDPIRILVEATKVIACGDYNHFTNVDSNDEIGDLSENFNQMIKNIKLYQDKLLSSEREKSELELASRIQTCLLPAIPDREHYEITATMIPAAEVGGDYYDLIGEANGRIWFGIGDVSGHGLTSGLIMMMAQTAFNTILLNEPDVSSDKLIAQVNKVMYQNIKQRLGEDHFMTLSFMVANPDGTVKFSGAHLDVLVYRQEGKKVERIQTSGVWLGLIPDIFENTIESELKLEKGDLMLLYTDGLIECTNKDNEQYDMERLMKKLEEMGDEPIKKIEEEIINDVFGFLNEQKDDITFVIARKK